MNTAIGRQRRLIFNNDGNDAHSFPKEKPATIKEFLAVRTTPLLDFQVDTISYCTITSGFSNTTHRTRVGSILAWNGRANSRGRNIVNELLAMGTDPLKIIADFCREHNRELFWSMRMNDTHDGQTEEGMYLFPPFKKEHPECLIGSREKRPEWPASWTAVDYTHEIVRDMAYRLFEEVCQGYDIDGIEMDFWRHLIFFKSVAWGKPASQAERDMMTNMLRRVRAMTKREGERRGRPILMAVKAPDSVELCMDVGLDLEQWMVEQLIDIFIPSGYVQLNTWEDSVKLGHKHGILVYPSLDESRIQGETGKYRRQSVECYRARAMNVWQAGADGICVFNEGNPQAPYLREIGDPATLKRVDKVYFVSVLGSGYDNYRRLPALSPKNPLPVSGGASLTVDMQVGEDFSGANPPQIGCHLNILGLTAADGVTVRLNGVSLEKAVLAGEWIDYPVRPEVVRTAVNRFEIALARPTNEKVMLKDICLSVRWD